MTQSNEAQIEQKQISLLWAGPETAGEIAQIQTQMQDLEWGDVEIRQILANPCSNSLIVKVRVNPESPPVTAGYVLGRLIDDEVEIIALGVLQPFQKFGLGRALIEGLTRAAKRAEATKMFLEVARDNATALSLYKKLGFEETGCREDYYKRTDGTKVDALTMTRNF